MDMNFSRNAGTNPSRPNAVHADIKAEEIRIPLKEEKVNDSKETFVKEEVSLSKRKVQGTEHVSEDLRKEELKVVKTGSAKVVKK